MPKYKPIRGSSSKQNIDTTTIVSTKVPQKTVKPNISTELTKPIVPVNNFKPAVTNLLNTVIPSEAIKITGLPNIGNNI